MKCYADNGMIYKKSERAEGVTYLGTHSIFIFRPTDAPHTVYATALQGAPTAEHAIAQAMPKVADCLSNEELIALDGVEFVDISKYLTAENASSKEGFTNADIAAFMREAAFKENREEQDRLWADNPAKHAVFTGLVLFMSHNEPYIPSRKITHYFSVPQELSDYLQTAISKRLSIPLDDVYVSPQVVAGHDVPDVWKDFQCAARDRLVHDVKYVKHMYDVQVHEAGQLLVPLYGIFVSFRKEFPRIISWKDYMAFVNSAVSDGTFDRQTIVPLFQGISSDAGFVSSYIADTDAFEEIYSRIETIVRGQVIEDGDVTSSEENAPKTAEGGALRFLKEKLFSRGK